MRRLTVALLAAAFLVSCATHTGGRKPNLNCHVTPKACQ